MYYKELDFPPIPEYLLEEEVIPSIGTDDIGYGQDHYKNGEKINPCSYWFSDIKNRELINWIWKNIPATKMVGKMTFQQAYHKTGGYHIVHSDILRSYAINYMIELGGDEAWTSWYKEKDQPLKRLKKGGLSQSDTGYIDYSNLELLDTVKFEQGKWYILSTDVLHDVGKIVGTRKSVTISIPPYLEKRTLENLLNDI
jgi:hypothetical protein